MFTGLVQAVGAVVKVDGDTIVVESPLTYDYLLGDSVAINGCCLTVTAIVVAGSNTRLAFALTKETKARCASFQGGVNIELPKKMDDRLHGHIVQGHVDTSASVLVLPGLTAGNETLAISLKDLDKRYIMEKGSVTVNGISLTVAKVKEDRFECAIIPYTLKHTNLNRLTAGAEVNIEYDILLKMAGGAKPKSEKDMMALAVEEGEKGRCTTAPNPWVGCVVASRNVGLGYSVLATGFHAKAGTAHAEVVALDALDKLPYAVRDATIFVTLEPCCHHGRTPPCANRILKYVASGVISRVVVGVLDPDPLVGGNGVALLRESGVEVQVGVAEGLVRESLRPYLYQRAKKMPFTVLKVATTLDGKMACHSSDSKWITGAEARENVQRMRAESQAILVGCGTVLSDNPRLTVRGRKSTVPLRVVIDPWLKLLEKPELNIFDGNAPTLVYYVESDRYIPTRLKNVEFMELEHSSEGKILWRAIKRDLFTRGVVQLLIEGGTTVATQCIDNYVADRIVQFQNPSFIGTRGLSVSKGPGIDRMDALRRLKCESVHLVGNDIRVELSCFHFPEIKQGLFDRTLMVLDGSLRSAVLLDMFWRWLQKEFLESIHFIQIREGQLKYKDYGISLVEINKESLVEYAEVYNIKQVIAFGDCGMEYLNPLKAWTEQNVLGYLEMETGNSASQQLTL
jgi:diaminohydroxyphosphoribosylaminopyrimidine deaminase/5-amino-6-(5-phosphoribosylamino)uracil reductase